MKMMGRTRKILSVLFSISVTAALPAGCKNQEADNTETAAFIGKDEAERDIDYGMLGIEEYEYPLEFSMGDNLKTAMTQLALSYENFDEDSVGGEYWKETFIDRFILNSRASFEYLDMVSDKNNGLISADELNYIHYSLTHTKLDFSSYADGSVNRKDSASFLNYGWICDYDYEYIDNGVMITAGFEIGYDGTDSMRKREIIVELVKNPYSCFDGYSVVSVSSKAASGPKPDNSPHVFYGTDMMQEDHGVFPFEFLCSEDDLGYKHIVYVDMTERPELAEFVRRHAGKDFRVAFIWKDGDADGIEKASPVEILLYEGGRNEDLLNK